MEETSPAASDATLARAARGGLCRACRFAEALVSGRGSTFLRCRHAGMPKYPPMPVLRCAGFTQRSRRQARHAADDEH